MTETVDLTTWIPWGQRRTEAGMWWSLLAKCRNLCQVAFCFWLFISGGREPEEEGQLGWGWFTRELEKRAGGTQASLTVLSPAGWQPTHFSL